MMLATAAGIAFSSFHESVDYRVIVDGVRRAALVFAAAIYLHFILLNLAGEWGRTLGFLQEHEHDLRGTTLAGYLRPFGLAVEPAYASSYMFLLAIVIWLAAPSKFVRSQLIFLGAALLTASPSVLLCLPVWLLVLLCRARAKVLVLWAVALCSLGALVWIYGDVLVTSVERTRGVAAGQDLSANARLIPAVRAIVGTWKEAPLLGFGINQARIADGIGRNYVDTSRFTYQEPDRYSGVMAAEIIADFGFPCLIVFGLMWFCGAMQGRLRKWSVLWVLGMVATQHAYFYRHAQVYYWCALGIALGLANRPESGPHSRKATTQA
jgi:hypothetical protein